MSSQKENHFDAVVIGSGMSGGWAAKELTERGLKTLVLERGRDVQHLRDYPTANTYPWEFEHRGQLTEKEKAKNPVVSKCYAFREDAMHFFTKDHEHPYVQEKPFDWIRGYQVGGKSLMWARQTQRWSEFDFEGPARDGYGTDWPIRYADLAPWYDKVERFVGIAGNPDGLDALPDGEFLPAFPLTKVEEYFQQFLRNRYSDRHLISGRCAHLTQPKEIHRQQGRAACMSRVLCQRGCPLGGYFSSNSSTLPWAARTGNMTLQPHAVVHSIIFDEQKGKVTGVRVIDDQTGKATEYFARIVFVNAGALNSNLILLNSTSRTFAEGLGNTNGLLGRYLAFHNFRGRISAEYDGFADLATEGRRPTAGYIPRFRNLYRQETDFLRGYAIGFAAIRPQEIKPVGVGPELTESLQHPIRDPWKIYSHMMGETIPKAQSSVRLDPVKTDKWGIPQLVVNVDYDDNDEAMIRDYHEQMEEMLEAAGFSNIQRMDTNWAPGLDIHEMGGVRMGRDPKSSLLNKWNQLHACPNVFVTDGACMSSTSTQNPSLTYMAITARAANRAADLMEKGEL